MSYETPARFRLVYIDQRGRQHDREVDAHRLSCQFGGWYLDEKPIRLIGYDVVAWGAPRAA
jgi:hypothetical protein